MKTCPQCQCPASEGSTTCLSCGASLQAPEKLNQTGEYALPASSPAASGLASSPTSSPALAFLDQPLSTPFPPTSPAPPLSGGTDEFVAVPSSVSVANLEVLKAPVPTAPIPADEPPPNKGGTADFVAVPSSVAEAVSPSIVSAPSTPPPSAPVSPVPSAPTPEPVKEAAPASILEDEIEIELDSPEPEEDDKPEEIAAEPVAPPAPSKESEPAFPATAFSASDTAGKEIEPLPSSAPSKPEESALSLLPRKLLLRVLWSLSMDRLLLRACSGVCIRWNPLLRRVHPRLMHPLRRLLFHKHKHLRQLWAVQRKYRLLLWRLRFPHLLPKLHLLLLGELRTCGTSACGPTHACGTTCACRE
ncbi:MAG: hypothetical protein H6727_05545 [Myxococcales bacterium]|nr:hypothetical protein [Myxococcales bacterium]